MSARAFLYCIKFDRSHHCKVGVTGGPRNRLSAMSGASPFSLDYVQLLEVESMELASAWERYILTYANRDLDQGEWVIYDDHLESLLAEVAPSACCLAEFPRRHVGRSIPNRTVDECFEAIHSAQLRARAGAEHASKWPAPRSIDEVQRLVVLRRLEEGYGAQDVLVMDGIPEKIFWAVVNQCRAAREVA